MKSKKFIFVAIFLTILLGLILYPQNDSKKTTIENQSDVPAPKVTSSNFTKDVLNNDSSKDSAHKQNLPKQQKILTSFFTENDFHKFVNENLKAAIDGNPKAQHLVGQALLECKGLLARKNFKNQQVFNDSLYEDKFYLSSDKEKQNLKDSFNKCKGFIGENLENKYGSNKEWRKKAFDSGYSLAVVENHNKQLLINPNAKDIDKRINHMLSSLTFNDPETFISMAGGSTLSFGNYDPVETFTAWASLACDQGVPCNSDASWVKNGCLWGINCGNEYDSPDKMLFGDLPPYSIAKSKELKQKLKLAIESGNWSTLNPTLGGK